MVMEAKDRLRGLKFSLSLHLTPANGVESELPYLDVEAKSIREQGPHHGQSLTGFYVEAWGAGLNEESGDTKLDNHFDNHFDGCCGYFECFYGQLDNPEVFWAYLCALDARGKEFVEVEFAMVHVAVDSDGGHIFSIEGGSHTFFHKCKACEGKGIDTILECKSCSGFGVLGITDEYPHAAKA